MTRSGGLADLSLFATSPSELRQFDTSYISPTDHPTHDVSCYSAQRQLNIGLERNEMMKRLPPLPRKRLCQRRPQTRRSETTSHCILDRWKRGRMHDSCCGPRPTLQQRRNHASVPMLTLSLPAPSYERRGSRRERAPRPTMVWMPEDQMWMIQEPSNLHSHSRLGQQIPTSNHARYRYTRSEPSPEPSALFNLPPLSPTVHESRSRDEPTDAIRNQFLRLMCPEQDERLSSLFQEAIQAVPPMTDPSPSTPPSMHVTTDQWMNHFARERGEDLRAETSTHDSFHTARASLGNDTHSIGSQVSRETPWVDPGEDPRRIHSLISRENPWDYPGGYDFAAHPVEREPRSVVSQLTHDHSWRDDHRSTFSPLTGESPWTPMAWGLTRSRSTTG